MIRKFEKKDINAVMEIWKKENIRAHNFIAKEYWKDNYEYVKDILPKADIYVYILDEKIVGFVGVNNNYIIIISENIDKNTNEIEYTMN